MLIGTSGWQYADWRDVLYPPGLAQRRWLPHYADTFTTVENNNAFCFGFPVTCDDLANRRCDLGIRASLCPIAYPSRPDV